MPLGFQNLSLAANYGVMTICKISFSEENELQCQHAICFFVTVDNFQTFINKFDRYYNIVIKAEKLQEDEDEIELAQVEGNFYCLLDIYATYMIFHIFRFYLFHANEKKRNIIVLKKPGSFQQRQH